MGKPSRGQPSNHPVPAPSQQVSDRPNPGNGDGVGQMIAVRGTYYQGPIPPASELEQYRLVLPDAPDRILAMAEKQEVHRHEMERLYVSGNIANERIGVITAGLLSIMSIAGGIYLLSEGKDISGLVTLLTPLAVLAGVYVYGRKTESKTEQSTE
jgi:uncharacterized membrane protein